MKRLRDLKFKFSTCFFLFAGCSGLFYDAPLCAKSSADLTDAWTEVAPYLIPEQHPVKRKLDNIFSGDVLQNRISLQKAGFEIIKEGRARRIFVVRHRDLPGYVLKVYVEMQTRVESDWRHYVRRIDGANLIQNTINKYGLQNYFKVPKKWIYPYPQTPRYLMSRYFALVAEDMKLLPSVDSKLMWKSEAVTPALLDGLYLLISELGLRDSLANRNIPFSSDGKVAFIDTEYYNSWPIPYKRVLELLSPKMREYWRMLMANRGPQ